MARKFTTQDIQDFNIEQVIITKSTDDQGNPEIRVRSNVTVELKDDNDSNRSTIMNIKLNKTTKELGISAAISTIKTVILAELRKQIQ